MPDTNAAVASEIPSQGNANTDQDLARRLFSVVDPEGARAQQPQGNAQPEGADEAPPTAEKAEQEVKLRLPNDAQNDEEPPAAEETFTFEIDGQTVQLSQAQLLEAAAKVQDAAPKQAETAPPASDPLEAERANLGQQRQQLETLVNQNHERLSALLKFGQPDWDQLLATDPQEFQRQRWEWEKIGREYQAVLNQKQALEQQAHHDRMAQLQQAEARERTTLLTKLPEWKDSARAKQDQDAIATYLKGTYGYDQDTINRIQDHREVLIALKAMKYDQLMDAAKTAKSKVRQLPPRIERAGTTQAPTQAENTRSTTLRRLSRTGSVEDAAAAFSAIFNEG